MRIVFGTLQHPATVAKGIRRLLAGRDRKLSLVASKDLTARLYGYAGWTELCASLGAPATPFDHLVPVEEATERRAQYRAALVGHGLDEALADDVLDAVRPTAIPDALPPLDIMGGPQADRLGVAGFDAPAFNLTDGGSRLLRAMRTAAAADPHWGRRGSLRAHAPDNPWIVRTLTDMRAAPTHRAWAPLAILCLAELAGLLGSDHPHVGRMLPDLRAGLAANDHRMVSAVLHGAHTEALLSLVAHIDDLLPILLGRHSPFPPVEEAVTPPEVHAPWRPRFPFDIAVGSPPALSLTREDLADLDLFLEGMPASMLLKVVSDRPVRDFREIHAAARAAGHDLSAGPPAASGPLERDDILLAASSEGTVLGAAVIRSRAKTDQSAFHIDVTGPFPIGMPPAGVSGAHVDAFLLAAAIARFEDDLRTWGRTVPPGGRLAIFVSPAREATDAFLRRFVHVAGNRYATTQGEMPDLGIDLVMRNATRDGSPARLPDLHLATVPGDAAQAWHAFERHANRVALELAVPVVVRLRPDGLVDLLAGDGNPLAGRSREADAAHEALTAPDSVDAVRHVVVEAGLGADASVFVASDFTAVLSRETVEDRDWTARRGICLMVDRKPAEGERERLLNRFWAAFPTELDCILAAAGQLALSPAHLVVGPSRSQ